MAWSLQAGTVATRSFGGDITPPLPAIVQNGDLLLLFLNSDSNVAVTSISPGTWTLEHSNADAADGFKVYSNIWATGQAAPTVTLGNGYHVACVVRVRGGGTNLPAQETAQTSTTTTASIDPPTAGSIKIAAVHIDTSSGWSGIDWTPGAATELFDGNIAAATRTLISAAYKEEDTAGAVAFSGSGTGTPGTLICSIAPTAPPPTVTVVSGGGISIYGVLTAVIAAATYSNVQSTYASYAALAADNPTYTDVLQ
jgi:hypothetical protein